MCAGFKRGNQEFEIHSKEISGRDLIMRSQNPCNRRSDRRCTLLNLNTFRLRYFDGL
jgi:hypothetical protein